MKKCNNDESDPYRVETLGILAIVTAIEHICKYHKVTRGNVTIACDNDASLQNGIDREKRSKTNNNYFDLFWAIQEIKRRITIELVSKKVAGHQDKHKKYHELTLCPSALFECPQGNNAL